MTNLICERPIFQLLTDSVRLYRDNFLVFFQISVLPLLPFTIVDFFSTVYGHNDIILVSYLCQFLVAAFTTGALSIAVSNTCLNNIPTFKRSFSSVMPVFWSYLSLTILCYILWIVGLIIFILPGIYAMVILMFSFPVCIIERRGIFDAMRRSRILSKGYYLRNFFVLMLMIGLLTLTILPMFAILILHNNMMLILTWQMILNALYVMAVPIIQIMLVLLYYEMRFRKENFDGHALAQELMT